jgi:ribosomal protein S1
MKAFFSAFSVNGNLIIQGTVTGTTKYGVFCEFYDCLTGMILIGDLTEDWQRRHEDGHIKPGDEIEFFNKEIVNPKKIILTQVLKYDPWSDITEMYTVPCETEGIITSIKEYGAFIKIDDEIVGLLHQSEFEDKEFEEGAIVKVKITRIDKPTKKVFLKLA